MALSGSDGASPSRNHAKSFRWKRPEAGHGILDAHGEPLATSDGLRGNIGYPGEPEGIEHFLKMVKGQCRHVDASQLGQGRKVARGGRWANQEAVGALR
jgi:hypothetical protein